jgi:hypothetical protein
MLRRLRNRLDDIKFDFWFWLWLGLTRDGLAAWFDRTIRRDIEELTAVGHATEIKAYGSNIMIVTPYLDIAINATANRGLKIEIREDQFWDEVYRAGMANQVSGNLVLLPSPRRFLPGRWCFKLRRAIRQTKRLYGI